MDIILRGSCTFFLISFRSSRAFFFLISFRSSYTFLKKMKYSQEAVTHFLKPKKIVQTSCTNFHGCCTKHTHFFHNLSRVMKTSMMDVCKNLFKNLTALYEYHRPRNNAYRNKHIIQVCFARMSPCLDHRP